MVAQLSFNDAILLLSLMYTTMDMQLEWESLTTCYRPVHAWLIVSFLCVVVFRLTQVLGAQTSTAESGSFLLDLRQKSTLARLLAAFTWLIALPFYIMLTCLGTFWVRDVARYTPQCMPTQTHLWFIILWLALSYLWIFVHIGLGAVAWALEQRVRRAERNLHQVQDDDMVSRWGQVTQIDGYRSLVGKADAGLSAEEISALPCSKLPFSDAESGATEEQECPICLYNVEPGDSIRQLQTCGHTFHKSCIDLWLLRRADCPLCKRCVKN